MLNVSFVFKGLRAPKTESAEPVLIVWHTKTVDDVAKDIFEKRWQGEKSWHGRETNRAYYRHLARVELARRNKGTRE